MQTEGRRTANESYRKTIPVWEKYSLNVSEASRILRNWRKEIETNRR
ncbi:MAG: excisionase [Eubacterium sp.]